MRKFLAAAFFLVITAVAVPVFSLSKDSAPKSEVRAQNNGPIVEVLFSETGKVVSMPMEEYLVGVVAAEMPASFPIEALKAQAVAARTYTLKRMNAPSPGTNPHPKADVCTDYKHCQAWIDKEAMIKKWNKDCDKYYQMISSAVAETRGQAICYNKAFIDPVYHSTSNGRTENSEDVWGSKVPYLRSVASRWDTESPKFQTTVEISIDVLTNRLSLPGVVLPVSSVGAAKIIQALDYTPTGRLKTVKVGGKTIPSTEVRQALDLPSTDLTWKVSKGKIIFSVKGYGHGVGMSQYGAKGMANEGRSYEEIIKHYYTGVDVIAAY